MPRISDAEFINRHRRLRALWLDAGTQKLYSLLSVSAQQELHAVYQPSENLSDLALIAHRREVSRGGSPLPNSAGQHYKQLNDAFVRLSTQLGIDTAGIDEALRHAYESHPSAAIAHADPSETAASRRVRVMGIARPELDYKKLAQVLVAASKDEKLMEKLTASGSAQGKNKTKP